MTRHHSCKHRGNHNSRKCRHDKKCPDKAVGTWAGTADVAPNVQYIQFQILPDGNLAFNSSLDIGQAFGEFPYGAALTHGEGYWKRVGHKKYVTRQTQLLSNKDLDPANNHVTIPIFRIVVNSTFTMSDDCQELNGEFVVQLYPKDDIHFQFPIGPPVPARPYKVGRLPPIE